jgi:hypothetical protein
VDAGDTVNARKYFKKACDESQDADVKTEACDLLRGTQ